MAETSEPEQIIDDPEEYSQTKRIQDLLNRRNDVLEARNRAIDEQTLGGAPAEAALRHYQSRIVSLILDLHTKFGGTETNGVQYLKDEPIDSITVFPPAEIMPDADSDMAPGETPPAPQEETIYGLQWFIEHDPIVRAEFHTRSWNPPGEQTAVGQRVIPIRTLDKALLKCMEFMDKLGVDADLDDKEQQTKIDRDLLEEVDEWRKQNINTEA